MSSAIPVTAKELLFTARLLRQQADRLLHCAMRAPADERKRDIESARDLERRAEQSEAPRGKQRGIQAESKSDAKVSAPRGGESNPKRWKRKRRAAMGDKSNIEWTDATWNPVTGCTKVSAGCKHCYAEREWARLVHLPAYITRAFSDVACHPERLNQPLTWTKPRRIFVNSMSDLFHPDVPDEFIDEVFAVMALATRHTFQVLTKRPERMLTYMSNAEMSVRDIIKYEPAAEKMCWPLPNVWLGVSVEDQDTANVRIPLLLKTPAAVRWISAEPLLGRIDLRFLWSRQTSRSAIGQINTYARLNWVVAGGESGPKARPTHPDAVRSLRDQCAAADMPFLFKQWGEWQTIDDMSIECVYKTPGRAPGHRFVDGVEVYRCGKRAAGRHLDGVLHDEYPSR